MKLRTIAAAFAAVVFCSKLVGFDSGSIPPWQSYVPGQYIDLAKHEEASRKFKEADDLNKGVATAITAVNEITEPEALMALWSVLSDPKSRVFYTTFTPQKPDHHDGIVHIRHPADDLDRPPSFDGLIGFRVVWQKEIQTPEGPKLISAITVFYFDKTVLDQVGLPKFFVRRAPATVRIRFEVKPFKENGTYRFGTGVIGFAWSTPFDFKLNRLVIESKAYVHEDGYLKYRYVGPFDLATHCISCHHVDKRNRFSSGYTKSPVEEMDGYYDFVDYVQNDLKLTDGEVEKLEVKMRNPREAFSPSELLTAIPERWKKIR